MRLLFEITSVKVTKRDAATILQKMHNNLRENCSPRPNGGCTCIVKQGSGIETVENYDSDEQCVLDITGTYILLSILSLREYWKS